jgi:hypothetical protein
MRSRGFDAVRAAFAVASVTVLALVVLAPVAGAGGVKPIDAPLTIVKVVDGPVPAGTTFEVTVHCDKAIIVDGGPASDTASVTFDEDGQPTSPDVIGFGDPGTCTVTETGTGGAASVAYACEGVAGTPEGLPDSSSFGDRSSAAVALPVCATTGPVDPIVVNISAPDQSGTVTVTNTFTGPQPQPAAEVVAAPAFTG